MSLDLIDARFKVTRETALVLDAIAVARETDICAVMREVLHEWATARIREGAAISEALGDQGPALPLASPQNSREAIPRSLRAEVFRRCGAECTYCGAAIAPAGAHVDHVLPVCQGGTNDLGNLTLSCARCNLEKAGRTPAQWREATDG